MVSNFEEDPSISILLNKYHVQLLIVQGDLYLEIQQSIKEYIS